MTHEAPKEAARRLATPIMAKGYTPHALHEYTDSAGQPLYWRIRARNVKTGDKWIRPMHLNGQGYTFGEPLFQGGKPLYRLHTLKAASEVWFVEGESCADALTKLGLVATTAGGASSDETADFSPLAGKSVRLWPDNDEPGKEHMQRVANKLKALGCTVSVVDIAALELPAKGDCVDWLAAHPHATRADVEALQCLSSGGAAPLVTLGSTWPEPTPLPNELPAVQPFDDALLPDAVRGWIADISERMQCPPDFPAVGALVALSSLIGNRVVVQPKALDDWCVVPNLWGGVVGNPGVMKSPALGEALRPLGSIEARHREDFEHSIEKHHIAQHTAKLKAESNEKAARKALEKNSQADVTDLLKSIDDKQEPRLRRLMVNDSTVEALTETLLGNQHGLLVFRDELYGLLRSMDKEGQEGARAFYLQAFDGDKPYITDRVGRGANKRLEHVCLALLGGIQPGRLAEYVRNAVAGGSGDDGLLQRFQLLVWPDSTNEWRNVDRFPDSTARLVADGVYQRLGASADTETPRVLRFDEAAQAMFNSWRQDFEPRLRSDDLHPAVTSHLAKYRKLVPALALLFSMIDEPEAAAIGQAHLARALAWAEYLETHAHRIYCSAVTPETAGAKTLLAKLRKGQLFEVGRAAAFTPRQLAVKHWTGLATPEAVRKAADLLCDFDWLKREIVPTGGRPTETYVINPYVWSAA